MSTQTVRRFPTVALLAIVLVPAILLTTLARVAAGFVNHGGAIVPAAPVGFWTQNGQYPGDLPVGEPASKQVAALQAVLPESYTDVYRHADDSTYAYLRGHGVDQVLVALNASGVDRTLDVPNLPDRLLPYPAGTVLVDMLGHGVSCTVAGGRCGLQLDADVPSVMLAPEVDVEVTRTGDRVSDVVPGQTVSYEFVVRNTDDQFSAHGVSVSHFLIDTNERFLSYEGALGMAFLRDVSVSDAACELTNGAIDCNWGDLGPGESHTVSIQGTVSYCYRIQHPTVTVFATTAVYSAADPNPDNDWEDKVMQVTGSRCSES